MHCSVGRPCTLLIDGMLMCIYLGCALAWQWSKPPPPESAPTLGYGSNILSDAQGWALHLLISPIVVPWCVAIGQWLFLDLGLGPWFRVWLGFGVGFFSGLSCRCLIWGRGLGFRNTLRRNGHILFASRAPIADFLGHGV